MKTAEVLVWLPGSPDPVTAGTFSWESGSVPVGRFEYTKEYLSSPGRFAIDPVRLPLKRGVFKEVQDKGIFGALRDSGPDS